MRTGTEDLVTKNIKWENWIPSSNEFKEVISPIIPSYTPNLQLINIQIVTPSSKDLKFIVYYSTNNVPVKITKTKKSPIIKKINKSRNMDTNYREQLRTTVTIIPIKIGQKSILHATKSNIKKVESYSKKTLPQTGNRNNFLKLWGLTITTIVSIVGIEIKKHRD